MKKNKKGLKKHGIISIVQLPDEENIEIKKLHKTETEIKPENQKEHGIISVVQAPDETIHA
jgi:hypothetical protein